MGPSRPLNPEGGSPLRRHSAPRSDRRAPRSARQARAPHRSRARSSARRGALPPAAPCASAGKATRLGLRQMLPRVIGHPEDPVTRIRTMLRDGRARVLSRTIAGGRAVWRLQLNLQPRRGRYPFPPATLLVDATTFVPIQLTSYGGGFKSRTGRFVPTVKAVARYLVYERLPYTPASRALLRVSPHPEARVAHKTRP
jgi:hypothetical protein